MLKASLILRLQKRISQSGHIVIFSCFGTIFNFNKNVVLRFTKFGFSMTLLLLPIIL